jgi:hypothetical protein
VVALLLSLVFGGAKYAQTFVDGRLAGMERPDVQQQWLGKRVLSRAFKDDADPSSAPDLVGVIPAGTPPPHSAQQSCVTTRALTNVCLLGTPAAYRARAPPTA